jgi:type I restriction enzyme S subunit
MEVRSGYKQTEVGVIPEDWEVKPLNALGQFKNGINKSSEAFGHGSPFVNLMDVFGVSRITSGDAFGLVETTEAEQKAYDLKRGDVLFIRSSVKPSGVGLTAVVETDLPKTVYSGFLLRFRDNNALDIGFKRHCFYADKFRSKLIGASSVSANTNINQDNLKKLLIALPADLPEQRAIAAALSDVDGLLGGLNRLIAKKRDLKQAAMQQLLTGQTRLPGFHSEWEVKRLGDMGKFLKGSGVTKDQTRSGTLACVRYGELYTLHNDVIREFQSWISPEVATTAIRLSPGDILFAGSGETKAEIGKCAAYVSDIEAYAGGDIVILRPKECDSLFLGYYLNIGSIARQKASRGQGDAVVHISSSALSGIRCKLPPLPEQTAIASVLSEMDTELSVLEQRREKTRALKQAMMQELLTGRTRLI